MSDAERLERLEQLFRRLDWQMTELRAELAAVRGGAGAVSARTAEPSAGPDALPAHASAAPSPPLTTASPSAARSAPGSRLAEPALDFESLAGRYGTIALATVAILVGVGAFLTWAVAHGLLGPPVRVMLGALGAALVAAVGWRLRTRGTVRYGNMLLALALAIVHLDMWGAGPRLHVLPTNVALAIAGIASCALAVLAVRANEELLFSVGLGGALLAPFVASSNAGNALVLAVYGCSVIGAGIFGLRTDRWRVALAILGAGGLLYVVSTFGVVSGSTRVAERYVPAAFGLVCAWTVFAWGRTHARAGMALWFLLLAALALAGAGAWNGMLVVAIPVAIVGTLTSYGVLRLFELSPPARVLAAVLLPLAFLGGADVALQHPGGSVGVIVAAGWTALTLTAAWFVKDDRDLHLTTAAAASAVAVLLGLHESPELCIIVLAIHVVVFSLVLRRLRATVLAWPMTTVLLIASLWNYRLLLDRSPYVYVPFLTHASLAALAVVLSWWAFKRAVRDAAGERDATGDVDVPRAVLEWMPAIAAYAWIQLELAGAFSAEIATFLLILFYALAGVCAIFYGRRHARRAARLVGLGLAFFAGIKALVQAWSFDAVGLRVGSCVLVGLFIALVAYWYRGQEGEVMAV